MLKTFNEVFDDYTKYGTKIKTEQYHTVGTNIIIDQGQADIAGYTDQIDGLFKDVPVIVFGDHTRIIKYINRPFFLGADGTKILKSKIPNANYKYLYYALKNAKIPNTGYNRHFKWLKQISISFPEHHKQSMIVEILDKLEDSIDNYNTILGLLDKLVKARFIEMFGDPVSNSKHLPLKTLPQLGTFGRGVSKYRPRNAPELLNGPYPLIQTGDIANSELYIKNYNNTYSEVGLKQSKMWDKGTLCITIAANIAKTAILQFDACFPDSVVGFNGNNLTNNIFVHYWFSFFQEILENQAPESAQKNINLKILSELQIITPDIIEQNQFADFVHQVDKSREEVKKSLEKTQQLYDSLMQEYFG